MTGILLEQEPGVLRNWWEQRERILTGDFLNKILINNYEFIWLEGTMVGIREKDIGCYGLEEP